jgi:hypothetical protein
MLCRDIIEAVYLFEISTTGKPTIGKLMINDRQSLLTTRKKGNTCHTQPRQSNKLQPLICDHEL